MTRLDRRRVTSSVACCLLLSRAAAAQHAPMPLETVLAMPVCPGSIGLLVEHTSEPPARERIAAALGDANPETRAAAARVAFVQTLRDLSPAILRSLDSETDAGAGRELVRAAVGLAPETELPRVVAAVTRIRDGASNVLVEQFGRSRRGRLGAAAPLLAPLGQETAVLQGLLRASIEPGQPPDAAFGSSALQVADAGLWRAYLGACRRAGRDVDAALLAEGLTAGNAEIRLASTWYVALERTPGPPENERLREALARARALGDGNTEGAAAVVLARRALGERPVQDPAVVEYVREPGSKKKDPRAPRGDCRVWMARKLLTGDELKAAKHLKDHCSRMPPSAAAAATPPDGVRTISELPDGLLSSLLESAGCEVWRGGMMAGRLQARTDGRAAKVVVPDAAKGTCGVALRALLSLTLTSSGRAVGSEPETVLVPLDPDQVACLDRSASAVFGRVLQEALHPTSAGVDPAPSHTPPRPLSHAALRPEWLLSARSFRPWQMSTRYLVSATGCTARVESSGTAPAEVKLAMVQQMLRARFEPARLHGQPVPADVVQVSGGRTAAP